MKIKWLQKFDNTRRDSIWYGGDIVTIKLRRYQVTIGAFGDIRAYIKGEHYVDKCNGGNFIEYLTENGINNDLELQKALANGDIEFEDNNWYEAVIWDNKKKEYVETWDTIIDDLDADDGFNWVGPWVKQLVR